MDDIELNDSSQSSEISNILNDSEMRTHFYATFKLCQNWSMPDSVLYYILKNPSTSNVYQKLTKTCKYFFIKNPYLIYPSLHYSDIRGWETWDLKGNHKKIVLKNVLTKLWIDYHFDIFSRNVNDKHVASSIIPRIGKCSVTALTLAFQNLSITDLKVFTPTVDFIYFACLTIEDEDGTLMEMEKIFELFTKIKKFQYKDDLNAPCITSKTFKNLLKIHHFREVGTFSLYSIPEAFDIETFYIYMKKNKHTEFNIDFSLNTNLSEAYKTRLQNIVDEILDAAEHDYRTPYIPFQGLNNTKLKRMMELFEKHDK